MKDEDAGAIYGRVGVGTQRGLLVVGVVGEFDPTDIVKSLTAFSTMPASHVFSRRVDWEAGVRARVGLTPNDTTLFYGASGPGLARIDRSFRSSQSTNSFFGSGKRHQFGIQGGGGVEQRIGRVLSVGLEYMYHQYRDDAFRVRAAGPAGTPFTNAANGGTTADYGLRPVRRHLLLALVSRDGEHEVLTSQFLMSAAPGRLDKASAAGWPSRSGRALGRCGARW